MTKRRSKVPKPFILVILGDSTAGKTTLLSDLKKISALNRKVKIRDIDDLNPPIPGRENWRKYRVDELLYQAIEDNKAGKSAIIGGWLWPFEIITSPYFSHKLNLRFLFLNNTKTEYRRRLRLRLGTRAMGMPLKNSHILSLVAGFEERKKRLENQIFSLSKADTVATDKLNSLEVLDYTLKIISNYYS